MQVRQGDVFVELIDTVPTVHEIIKLENGKHVLAYGEATGHKHQIKSKNALLVKANGKMFLIITKPVELKHEEHEKIILPTGNFKVTQQKEYRPGRIINVAD